jgi:hypothetical protein
LGAAAAALEKSSFRLNFLAEQSAKERSRKRDPVRWAKRFAMTVMAMVAAWVILLSGQFGYEKLRFGRMSRQLQAQSGPVTSIEASRKTITKAEKTIHDLTIRASNKYFWTGPLSALQFSMVDGIVVARLSMEERLTMIPSTRKTNVLGVVVGKSASSQKELILTIVAKDYGVPTAAEKFVDAIKEQEWFKQNLRPVDPVLLRDRQAEQVDVLDQTKTFRLTRIECHFKPIINYDE